VDSFTDVLSIIRSFRNRRLHVTPRITRSRTTCNEPQPSSFVQYSMSGFIERRATASGKPNQGGGGSQSMPGSSLSRAPATFGYSKRLGYPTSACRLRCPPSAQGMSAQSQSYVQISRSVHNRTSTVHGKRCTAEVGRLSSLSSACQTRILHFEINETPTLLLSLFQS
jgi:hypothetical protein